MLHLDKHQEKLQSGYASRTISTIKRVTKMEIRKTNTATLTKMVSKMPPVMVD